MIDIDLFFPIFLDNRKNTIDIPNNNIAATYIKVDGPVVDIIVDIDPVDTVSVVVVIVG